jgi:hypothetical protein
MAPREERRMKIRVMFKTPDAVERAIDDVVDADDALDDEDRALLKTQADNFICGFVRYGELITIEFDTEAETATVVPVK